MLIIDNYLECSDSSVFKSTQLLVLFFSILCLPWKFLRRIYHSLIAWSNDGMMSDGGKFYCGIADRGKIRQEKDYLNRKTLSNLWPMKKKMQKVLLDTTLLQNKCSILKNMLMKINLNRYNFIGLWYLLLVSQRRGRTMKSGLQKKMVHLKFKLWKYIHTKRNAQIWSTVKDSVNMENLHVSY